ncbi:MAG: inositol-phosphate transport system permease protein [Thermotogota bacterium]|nr:inositol-phosphate transport system permease protein [Thermotogota bacterium]MDK2864182.1 inositol-phosphate transport system permease protein [Thermotogota bacterium]HCZ07444.1 carbohydrate ABC transporter permease [Thermotogota bacterium]
MSKSSSSYRLTFFQRNSQKIAQAVIITILVLITLPIIVGYVWLIVRSFSEDIVHGFIPTKLTLKNWRFLWQEMKGYPNIWQTTLNTFLLALGVMAIEIAITSMGGYVLSRYDFPGRSAMLKFILVLHAFPAISLMVAIFYVLWNIGLLDKLWGIILLKASLEIPWGSWIMKGFYDGIPWELEWAGLVDGYGRMKVWAKIMLPLVKPGMAVTAIFAFLSGWSEFIFVYTFIFSQKTWTLSRYVMGIIGDYRFADYGLLAAVGLFYVIPSIIFFFFVSKYMIKLTIGGVKG